MVIGSLKHSRRCYHWLFVWVIIFALIGAIIYSQKRIPGGTITVLISMTLVFGYSFLIDISDAVWWTDEKKIYARGLSFFSAKVHRKSFEIMRLSEVKTENNPANWLPGRPFDSILLESPSDNLHILPSFHKREELEDLMRYILEVNPQVKFDKNAAAFMNGNFSDWWKYR